MLYDKEKYLSNLILKSKKRHSEIPIELAPPPPTIPKKEKQKSTVNKVKEFRSVLKKIGIKFKKIKTKKDPIIKPPVYKKSNHKTSKNRKRVVVQEDNYEKVNIVRPPATYSNTSPYGIAADYLLHPENYD